jgi:hypothetical protein
MAHQVFICYSSKDKLVADAACAALEAQRIPCWIAPRDVLGGEEYGKAIIEALSACQFVLLIFSRHANDSAQVRREIERAASKEKIIVPFRIEDVLPSDAMEYAIGNTHWLDAITPPMERRLAELCETISRLNLRQKGAGPMWQPQEIPPTTAQVVPEPKAGGRKLPLWAWGTLAAVIMLLAVFAAGRLFVPKPAPTPTPAPAQPATSQAAPDPGASGPQIAPKTPGPTASGTWTDPATGLIWTKKDNGFDVSWQQATDYCRNLQLAGHSDWRMPTINELQGAYDPSVNISGLWWGTQLITWHAKGNLMVSGWEWSSNFGATAQVMLGFSFASGNQDPAPPGNGLNWRTLCVRRDGPF